MRSNGREGGIRIDKRTGVLYPDLVLREFEVGGSGFRSGAVDIADGRGLELAFLCIKGFEDGI